jgi:putative two-component system response regulator
VTPCLRTIVTLARAVQDRDPYAAGRSERVTRLAQRTAVALGLGADHHHAIAVGVVCADIGKIGLPDRLLHGRGTLSDDDYATLRSYPAMSSYILGELELPQLVKEMARWHLERWDGNGGPDGLAGESIPIFARILAVADAVDAASFSEVAEQSGTRFCPTTAAATHRAPAADRALRDYVAA